MMYLLVEISSGLLPLVVVGEHATRSLLSPPPSLLVPVLLYLSSVSPPCLFSFDCRPVQVPTSISSSTSSGPLASLWLLLLPPLFVVGLAACCCCCRPFAVVLAASGRSGCCRRPCCCCCCCCCCCFLLFFLSFPCSLSPGFPLHLACLPVLVSCFVAASIVCSLFFDLFVRVCLCFFTLFLIFLLPRPAHATRLSSLVHIAQHF